MSEFRWRKRWTRSSVRRMIETLAPWKMCVLVSKRDYFVEKAGTSHTIDARKMGHPYKSHIRKHTFDDLKRRHTVLGHTAHVAFESLRGVFEEVVEVCEGRGKTVEAGVEVHAVHLDFESTGCVLVL
jgi:hypothetical protein